MNRILDIGRIWRSFTGRMVLGVLVIHAVLAPMLFLGILLINKRSMENQFIDQVRADSYLLASSIARDLAQTETAHVVEVLDEALTTARVLNIEIVTVNGTVIGPSGKSPLNSANFNEDFFFGDHGDEIYQISLPLQNPGGKPLGALRLNYDERPTKHLIQTTYQRGAALTVGYVSLSLLLVVAFGASLSRPVQRLRNLAGRIASGHDAERLIVPSGISEVQDLARDLESMRQVLVLRRREVMESEARLRSILENVAEGILTFDDEGRIRSFNRAAESIFDVSADEVIGEDVNKIMPLSTWQAREVEVMETTQSGRRHALGVAGEVEVKRRSGYVQRLEFVVSDAWVDNGHLFTCIVRDITQKQDIESDLAESLQVTQDSLELLGVAINEAEQFREHVGAAFKALPNSEADPKAREIGENALRTSASFGTKLGSLRNLYALSNSPSIGCVSDFDLVEMAEETMGLLAPAAHSKLLDFALLSDAAVPETVLGDKDRLHGVLTTLLNRAITMTEEGQVTCRIVPLQRALDNLTIRIEIARFGHSVERCILEETHGRSIQKFLVGSDGCDETDFELMVCHRSITHMGGQFGIQAEGDGKTTYWLTVPLKISGGSTRGSNETKRRVLTGRRVLVLDGQAASRQALQAQLAHLGIEVCVAADAEEAIRTFRGAVDDPFDLIMLDMHLPLTDRSRFIAFYQSRNTTNAIPVILLRRATQSPVPDESIWQALRVGATLDKPVTRLALERVLTKALQPGDQTLHVILDS